MTNYEKLDVYLEKNLNQSISELSRLAAQPSVGAQNWGLAECARLVAEMLHQRGFTTEVIETGGAPVVYGELRGKGDKTLLIYNHYDVQPPEPLELWDSPPFQPEIRDGKLYGRGVSDDKGHIVSRLFAIDALRRETGELPCTIKFLIEGEEETSSAHLFEFVASNVERLKADVCLWESGGVDQREVPIQYLGMRGICYVELSVETATSDAHSGLGGSIFPNAAWRLVWALNTLKGPDEHIRLPGFYDAVLPPSERDRALLAAQPDAADEYKSRYGIDHFLKGLIGGVELQIAEVFEPTCTICGLTSGYQGPGSKTVLPKYASAKVDFRLVPEQRPEQVLQQLREHLDREGFPDIQITDLGGDAPARTDPDDPYVQLMSRTAEPVYGMPMQLVPLTGGSGPSFPFVNLLKLPVVAAGIGYPGTLAHAPNENIRLDLYLKHARHMVRFLSEIGELPPK